MYAMFASSSSKKQLDLSHSKTATTASFIANVSQSGLKSMKDVLSATTLKYDFINIFKLQVLPISNHKASYTHGDKSFSQFIIKIMALKTLLEGTLLSMQHDLSSKKCY